MKSIFSPSVVRDQMKHFATAFLLTLVFFFTQNTTSVFAKEERCKVGDPSVAEYNHLSLSREMLRHMGFRTFLKTQQLVPSLGLQGLLL